MPSTVSNILIREGFLDRFIPLIPQDNMDRFYVVGGLCRDVKYARDHVINKFSPSDIDIVIPTVGRTTWTEQYIKGFLGIVKKAFPEKTCRGNSYFPNGITLEEPGKLSIDLWVAEVNSLVELLKTFTLNIQRIGTVHCQENNWGKQDKDTDSFTCLPDFKETQIRIVAESKRPESCTMYKILKALYKYSGYLTLHEDTKAWIRKREDKALEAYISAWKILGAESVNNTNHDYSKYFL